MYKEIHPYFFDSAAWNQLGFAPDKQSKDFMKEASPRFIKLDIIRQISSSGHEGYSRISVSDDYTSDIIVKNEEADEIKAILLKQDKSKDDSVAQELSHLTMDIRDLWNLLRARMR